MTATVKKGEKKTMLTLNRVVSPSFQTGRNLVLQCGALVAALLCTATAFANSGNGVQTVVSVEVHDSQNALVVFAGGSNTEVCGGTRGGTTLAISKSNPNFKTIYSTAMAALVTNRQVDSVANGCVDIWGDGSSLVPQITAIILH